MMMEQVYTPNINVSAAPAMCLGYVDDGGNAPNRSNTAKEAFLKEQAAGRISLGQLPDKVWVVVWFSFSTGSYTYSNGYTVYFKNAWHVAFARRDGDTVQIHDSEVHSGARKPYTALAAVEAWFAAYGAKYVGWSGSCDGRTYAIKKEENEMLTSVDQLNSLYQRYRLRNAKPEEVTQFLGRVSYQDMITLLGQGEEAQEAFQALITGQVVRAAGYGMNNIGDLLKSSTTTALSDQAVDSAIREAEEALAAAKALKK